MADADDECVDPKVPKQGIKEHISGLIRPLNLGKEWEILSRNQLSNRHDISSDDCPKSQPGKNDNTSKWWCKEHLWSSSNKGSSTLHNGNSNSDVLLTADGATEEAGCNAPNNI